MEPNISEPMLVHLKITWSIQNLFSTIQAATSRNLMPGSPDASFDASHVPLHVSMAALWWYVEVVLCQRPGPFSIRAWILTPTGTKFQSATKNNNKWFPNEWTKHTLKLQNQVKKQISKKHTKQKKCISWPRLITPKIAQRAAVTRNQFGSQRGVHPRRAEKGNQPFPGCFFQEILRKIGGTYQDISKKDSCREYLPTFGWLFCG